MEMETPVVKDAVNPAPPVQSRTQAVLAFAVTVGFFGMIVLLSEHDIPTAEHDLLLILLGGLSTQFGSVINYYFGSSSGSAAKSNALESIATKK